MHEDMTLYFSGEKLYGDDFTLNQIEEWYKDEQEELPILVQRTDRTTSIVFIN